MPEPEPEPEPNWGEELVALIVPTNVYFYPLPVWRTSVLFVLRLSHCSSYSTFWNTFYCGCLRGRRRVSDCSALTVSVGRPWVSGQIRCWSLGHDHVSIRRLNEIRESDFIQPFPSLLHVLILFTFLLLSRETCVDVVGFTVSSARPKGKSIFLGFALFVLFSVLKALIGVFLVASLRVEG